jgi:hypothetical protein
MIFIQTELVEHTISPNVSVMNSILQKSCATNCGYAQLFSLLPPQGLA